MSDFKFALRALLKNRTYTLLNVVGLAIGLAISIVVYLHIRSELRYDTSVPNYRNIYRVNAEFRLNKEDEKVAGTSLSLAPLLVREYSYIDAVTRFVHYDYNVLFKHGSRENYESGIAVADSNFFRVFKMKFLHGTPKQALVEPRSIVVTQNFAQRYFNGDNPVGKVISTNNYDYTVTGLIKNLPANTHHDFDAVINAFNQPLPEEKMTQSLWEASVYSFLRLDEPAEAQALEADFEGFYEKYMLEAGENLGGFYDIDLTRLDRIHYGAQYQFDRPVGSRTYLYAFGAIGVLILILACINYINMATARGMKRLREAGLRKILGSSNAQLRSLVLAESTLLSLFSLFIAFVLVESIFQLTPFNAILGKDLALDFLRFPSLWYVPLGLALLVCLLSGWYPAMLLSRVSGLAAIRGDAKGRPRSNATRKLLVGFQFCISVSVVITALLMHRQMDYVKHKDLGFNKEDVVLIPIQDTSVAAKIPRLRTRLDQTPYVVSSSVAWSVPGGNLDRTLLSLEQNHACDFKKDVLDIMHVGLGYLNTMEIELLSGRDFIQEDHQSQTPVMLVNQELAQQMNWQHPIGKIIRWGFEESGRALFEGPVVGVVGNFNSHSLHNAIEPTVLFLQRVNHGSMHIRVDSHHFLAALNNIENAWGEVDERNPFRFTFLDKNLMGLYQEEQRQSSILLYLTYLAIFISFLGLTGLASFTTSMRAREIGIRKVLGADVTQMVNLIFKDMLVLVIAAVLLALPLAYFLTTGWLSGFAYAASLDPMIFGTAAVFAVVLAYAIVSYHSLRVAQARPVDTLKYE
ncbi:MAG: ABC transporter permease [Owenweeksia sp.]|nr:ABC transporter permease [Owenweeksia sp.]